MRLSALTLLGIASIFLFVSWLSLWPLASVSTFEAKPRSLFIAERALAPPSAAHARFGLSDVRRAAATARALSVPPAAGLAALAQVLALACARAHLASEILPMRASGAGESSGNRVSVVCAAPAAGIARGVEYVLLSAAVAAPGGGGGGGAAAAAAVLAAAALAARAPWLAKDVVVLLVVHDAADADAAASAGLAEFFRAHDYDGLAEARRRAVLDAWHGGAALPFLRAWARGDWPPLDGGDVQPLAMQHGVLRAALHVEVTEAAAAAVLGDGGADSGGGGGGSRAPVIGVAVAAPGSRMPELDLPSLLFDILAHHRLRAVVGDAAHAGAGAGAGAWAAADCAVAGAADAAARWAASAGGGVALQPWLSRVVAPLAALAGGGDGAPATGGDAAVYARRLATAARMLLRLLLGPYAPHAVALLRGAPAATLRAAAAEEWECAAGPRAGAPPRAAACHALAPCDEQLPVAAAAAAAQYAARGGSNATAAVALGASLEHALRALTGLEERLHASPPGYVLLSPRLFVGLAEAALAAACLHVPLLAALLLAGWRAPRQAAADEVVVAAFLAAVAAAKLAACLLAGMPAGAAPAADALPALLAAADVAAAVAAALLRRALAARRPCCPEYISPAEDDADEDAAAGGDGGDCAAAPVLASAPAHAARPTAAAAAPAAAAAATLPPALFFAWLALGAQQLQLLYVDLPLFIAAAAVQVPVLLALSSAAVAPALHWPPQRARRAPPSPPPPPPPPPPPAAAAAAAAAMLAAAYCAVAPVCWPALLGGGAAQSLLRRLLSLLRDHGALHVPVLLHAQAALALVASAALARAW
jgi:hypothetical protein